MAEIPKMVVVYVPAPFPVHLVHSLSLLLSGFIAALALNGLVSERWLALAAVGAAGGLFACCLTMAIGETRRRRAERRAGRIPPPAPEA
jgi:hypothetical protein